MTVLTLTTSNALSYSMNTDTRRRIFRRVSPEVRWARKFHWLDVSGSEHVRQQLLSKQQHTETAERIASVFTTSALPAVGSAALLSASDLLLRAERVQNDAGGDYEGQVILYDSESADSHGGAGNNQQDIFDIELSDTPDDIKDPDGDAVPAWETTIDAIDVDLEYEGPSAAGEHSQQADGVEKPEGDSSAEEIDRFDDVMLPFGVTPGDELFDDDMYLFGPSSFGGQVDDEQASDLIRRPRLRFRRGEKHSADGDSIGPEETRHEQADIAVTDTDDYLWVDYSNIDLPERVPPRRS